MTRLSRAAPAALAFALALTPTGGALAANTSAYSTLAWETGCLVVERSDEGPFIRLICEGYGNYMVHVAEGDLRMSLDYGIDPATGDWESFGAFNYVNDTVEWRLGADGAPFATIHRWFVSDLEGNDRPVLVVSTVARAAGQPSCVAGYVDAGAVSEANRLARQVADEVAAGFRCGVDEPRYHGPTRQQTPQPVRP
jgi:hypothetical protein